VLCSPHQIKPAKAHLPPSVQTLFLHRHDPDHRTLLVRNAGSHLPLPWLQPHSSSKNRADLPLDALHHSMLFPLGSDGLSPLPVTSQSLLAKTYPDPHEGRSYPQTRRHCRDPLMSERNDWAPDPSRYPYLPSLKPYLFMGLNKFDASRLHQMRSGKSYLRAHLSWDNENPTTCPRFDKASKTFKYAILSCPPSGPSRSCHLQAVTDIDSKAPV